MTESGYITMNKKQKYLKKRKKEYNKLNIKPVEIKYSKEDLWYKFEHRYELRKLPFQWIPKFHLNARKAMGDYDWTKLSKEIRQKANYTCEYCGEYHPESHGTECHEEWDYLLKEGKGIYVLRNLKCVCKKCHSVCHPGATQFFGRDVEEALNRYCAINKVDKKTMIKELYESKAIRDYLASSVQEWELEENIFDKIEVKYGIKCRPKNIIEF